MVVRYDELKEAVGEDFERFSQWGFNEEQIFPAILNEYKYGEGFSQIENICVHIFIILNYKSKMMNYDFILTELKKIILAVGQGEVKSDLGVDFSKFISDYDDLMNS